MIPFNKIYLTGKEYKYIQDAISLGHLSGDGHYSKLSKEWLEKYTQSSALLTTSCTSALELSASLLNISPGDEIIMSSFTFVSTANAFILRGATPVFVDIKESTLNIDEDLIERAITSKTKAIVVTHYAGVSCEMDKIKSIANSFKLPVIEDAAQGMMATYKNSPLGSIGDLGCLSFHDTKNIIAGEAGALLVNNSNFLERAEILKDKGTNRKKFLKGEIDKYSWTDIGSSYVPSELVAAFLLAQLEKATFITNLRIKIWDLYHAELEPLEKDSRIIRPTIPKNIKHNAHIYYLLLNNIVDRNKFIQNMREKGVICSFHYTPLHNSPAGVKWGKTIGKLRIVEEISNRIVRLPLWPTIDSKKIIKATFESLA